MELKELAQEFFDLFKGYSKAHGQYIIGKKTPDGKLKGQAKTVRETPTVEKWQQHLKGGAGIGIIPINDEDACWFGCIDIDINDIDHKRLEEDLGNLPLLVGRSKSGGAHLWAFFEEPVSADLVQSRLMEWAALLGFGGCEVFPKQIMRSSEKDTGNWINMPYHDAKRTTRYIIRKGQPLSAEEFLAYAKTRRIPVSFMMNAKVEAAEPETFDHGLFEDGPPCLQYLTGKGFPEGTRNQGLTNVACYFKVANPDGWQDDVISYNQKHMDPPLRHAEVDNIIKSVAKKKYTYTCKQPPIREHCNRKLCRLRRFGIGNGGAGGQTITMGSLSKIDSDPPIWIADLEGHRVELDTESLLSQRKFQIICAEKIHRVPPPMNPTRWAQVIQEAMENVEIIPAPEDASRKGQFELLLIEFCANTALARSRDEIILGKPFAEDGKVYFRSSDLLAYLEAKKFRHDGPHKVWAMLRDLGAGRHAFSIASKCVQCWYVTEPDPGEALQLQVPEQPEDQF